MLKLTQERVGAYKDALYMRLFGEANDRPPVSDNNDTPSESEDEEESDTQYDFRGTEARRPAKTLSDAKKEGTPTCSA